MTTEKMTTEKMTTEKLTTEKKYEYQTRFGGWAQRHAGKIWRWHYIDQGTERVRGTYYSRRDADRDNKK